MTTAIRLITLERFLKAVVLIVGGIGLLVLGARTDLHRLAQDIQDQLDLIRAAGPDLVCLQEVTMTTLPRWERLLGAEGFALARQIAAHHVPLEVAATQVWCLKEAFRKAGAALAHPLSLSSVLPDGWTLFHAGGFKAAAFHTLLQETGARAAFAFVIAGAP